jgi:tRNA (mo5U34)-methyltransferase
VISQRQDIASICERAYEFKARLDALKNRLNPDFEWYRYDSFGNFGHIQQLLNGDNRYLLDLAAGDPVLDIGCADGDLSFFLESLGLSMHAIDCGGTNHNGMRGIRALKEALQSPIDIHEVDLDAQFSLPSLHGRTFGLTFFLGILYHLKNPVYALERLVTRTRYLLLSTRVARFTPDRRTDLGDAPVAYLLARDEANNDSSNYWIFTEAGVRRLLDRTGWDICDWLTCGATDSDPSSSQGDARVFCLARSRSIEPITRGRLLKGWHALEPDGWRWTERKFSVSFQNQPVSRSRRLELRFHVPEAILASRNPVRLCAVANGTSLPPVQYREAGSQVYSAEVPAEVCASGRVDVEFEVDRAVESSGADQRELALIVTSVELR